MDKFTVKRDAPEMNQQLKKMKKDCTYGQNCYRKNPDHLKEYNHSHLEKILSQYQGHGDFKIPANLQFQKEVIAQQLRILIDCNIYCVETEDSVQNKTPFSLPVDRQKGEKHQDKVAVMENENKKKKLSNESDVATSSNSKSATDTLYSLESDTTETLVTNRNHPVVKRDSGATTSRKIEDFFEVVAPKGLMDKKHRNASPYYIFFTTVSAAPQTHSQPLSITFQELLDCSLGMLQSSLQINFMVDLGWLLAQYYFAGYSEKPLTILYGAESEDLKAINRTKPNIQAHQINMGNAFGIHHTKMTILCYDDKSIRIVISTANLYIDDWDNRTQGLWLSPRCPRLADPSDITKGESPTGFKRSLIQYLSAYSMPCLSQYIEVVKHCDFSEINVFFVASVPGGHFGNDWGLSRVGSLLKKYCELPTDENDRWDFIVQASSIGSYGKEPKLWLTGDFQTQFCMSNTKSALQTRMPPLRMVYPSVQAVRQSHDNLLGGGCLPYSNKIHEKQPWLEKFMHEWQAAHSGRNRAMPHIKSYLRLSPDFKKAAYFILTSANISKSAWGAYNKGNRALRINSYEAGVLFLPQFVISKSSFSVELNDASRLPVPYDLPPIPYAAGKTAWVQEYMAEARY